MDNKKWTIGRQGSTKADILISNDSVSSIHAFLYFINGSFFIQDDKSTNGTYIERSGEKKSIQAGELFPSDRIYFGNAKSSLDELISESNTAKSRLVNEEEIVVVRQLVETSSRVFATNVRTSAPRQKVPMPKPSVVKPLEKRPKQKPVDTKVKPPEPIKPQASASQGKQKCPECGMVISKNTKCQYCGN